MSNLLNSPGMLKTAVWLNYVFLFVMMLVIAGILTAALVLQYGYGELPCPLCLLQRLSMFGVCFGIIQSFRTGFSYQNTGLSLLFATLLLVIAARQTLLDIYPRPGHEYIGSAVLGIHMPVWSVIITLCILTAFALKLTVLGDSKQLTESKASDLPVMGGIANVLGLYVMALCLVNTVSVLLQCGLNECHTFGYQLLQ